MHVAYAIIWTTFWVVPTLVMIGASCYILGKVLAEYKWQQASVLAIAEGAIARQHEEAMKTLDDLDHLFDLTDEEKKEEIIKTVVVEEPKKPEPTVQDGFALVLSDKTTLRAVPAVIPRSEKMTARELPVVKVEIATGLVEPDATGRYHITKENLCPPDKIPTKRRQRKRRGKSAKKQHVGRTKTKQFPAIQIRGEAR